MQNYKKNVVMGPHTTKKPLSLQMIFVTGLK